MKGIQFSRIFQGVAALCLILTAVQPTAAQDQTVKLGGTLPPGYKVTQVDMVGVQSAIKSGLLVDSNYFDARAGGIATYVNAFILSGTAIIAVQPEDGFPWVFYPLGSGYLFSGGPIQRVKLLRTSVAIDGTITVLGQIAGFYQSFSTDDCQAFNLDTGYPDGATSQVLYDPEWNGMGYTEGSVSNLGGQANLTHYFRWGANQPVPYFDEVLNGLQGMYVYDWAAWIEARNVVNDNLCAKLEWDWSLLQDSTPTPTPTTTPSAVPPSPTPTPTELPPTATPWPTPTPSSTATASPTGSPTTTPTHVGCVGFCIYLPLVAAGDG